MAWIESHQKLASDPKLFDLMTSLSISRREAVGLLHMLWWWCVDHAENGDLRRFNPSHLSLAMDWDPKDAENLVNGLVKAGFLEQEPYFRISKWWKFSGRFMKQKYKDYPEKWKQLESMYSTVTVAVTATQETYQHTNIPTDRLTRKTDTVTSGFAAFWTLWPKKFGKEPAAQEWARLRPPLDLQAAISKAVKAQTKALKWDGEKADFCPKPARWLKDRGWEDEVAGGKKLSAIEEKYGTPY